MMKINMSKLQKICSGLLLAFSLVSIGFMLGKNSVESNNNLVEAGDTGDHVAVYYLHSTFRCETCNQIEAMTKELLEREYSDLLSDGRMTWKEIDFMKNTELAEEFEIAASCVVVAQIRNGEVIDYQRLDGVWSLLDKPDFFNDYIRSAIEAYLNPEEKS